MKKISKWPARALNLLVVLAMVISLCVLIVAPPVAAAECNPTEVYAPCHLEVFVNTYAKDVESGAFTPQSTFNVGDSFYVNAVVVNTGNETCGNASNPCLYNAEIVLDAATMALDPYETGNKSADEPIDQLGSVHMQDFWWRGNCTAEGNSTITVNVHTSGCAHNCQAASGSTCVVQVMPPTEKCLDIEIIEAPGLNSPLPQQISVSTDFGIKAKLTNNCAEDFGNVSATLSFVPVEDSGTAEVVNDTYDWPLIGGIPAGKSEIVAWTLHCTGPGDVKIKVNATQYIEGNGTSLDEITNFINNPYTVVQIAAGSLDVTIDTPGNGTSIPTGCGQNTFPIVVTVKNLGDTAVNNVYAQASASNGFVSISMPTQIPLGNISGRGNATATWSATCTGPGDTDILVTATGDIAGGSGTATGNDTHTIHQKSLITEFIGAYRMEGNGTLTGTPLVIPLDEEGNPVSDGQANICQQYQVMFRMTNYTGTNWNNATACIYWTGNASIAGSVYERKYAIGATPGNWTLKDASPGNMTPSCEQNLVICSCCVAEIKWTFQCTGTGNATFHAVGTRGVYTDTSRTVLINQEYKAHLIGGIFSFFQDENMIMQPRDAFSPSQRFHVVYPVVNTGDADAKNVTVNFQIIGNASSYALVGFSGDVVEGTFDPQTGLGSASLGDIAGKSSPECTPQMKKMILLVECEGAGDVQFWYSQTGDGITGTDENTDAAIQTSNIVYPVCPITVQQIPFTVRIINPEKDQNFEYSDNYSVKALISNLSTMDLEGVNATLSWGDGEPVELVDVWEGAPQELEKDMGVIEAGRLEEITWQVHCNGEGDVTFRVTAVSEDPSLNAVSDSVTVHQIPAPKLEIEIVSPVATNTTIATGEQFAVSAMVLNSGGRTAEDVQVDIGDYNGNVTFSSVTGEFDLDKWCITPGAETIWVNDVEQVRDVDYAIDNYAFGLGHFLSGHIPGEDALVTAVSLDQVSLVAPSERVQDIGDLGPNEHAVVTWTLRAETTCQGSCNMTEEDLDVAAWGSNADLVDATVEPGIDIYPAAFLVTVIDSVTPVIKVCDEFQVSYKVYNIGQADAWNASATLSVTPEGSVRIAGGQTGYTQPLGTIAGWRSGDLEDRAYAQGTFTLHCKMACESTLTITPAGYDECGWGPVFSVAVGGFGLGPVLAYVPTYEWLSVPGSPIMSKFLEAASTTVKQLDSGQLDLAITKTVDNAFPTAGQTVNFTIMVTNSGPTAASGVKVHDALPAGLTFVSATVSQGSYSTSTKDWTVGSLIVGGSASLKIAATVGNTSLITNTASITAVDQPDPYSDNNSASVSLNVPAVTSVDIALKSGWNLISLPLIPNNSAIATVLAGVLGNVSIVYGYDPGTGWKSYIPGGPTPSLTTMVDGKGYWINMTAAATLTVHGVVNPLPPATPPAYSVAAGWNLIGFKSTTAMTAGDYLAAIAGQWTRIWGYTNGQYGAVTSSGMLQPGGGYWIAVTSAGTIFP